VSEGDPWDTSWAAYVAGHPERLPRAAGETWADVPHEEARRVGRNWKRWRKRRLRWMEGRPTHFFLKGGAVVVEAYPGRGRA
jgi:hypothetical protein